MYFTKAIKRLTILAALALTCQTVDAQQIEAARSHYSTEDGLCSNAISMLYQDDLGYIWIATWNGLSRFDGYNFYNYKTGNGSRIKNLHNRIRDLAIDQSQNIWLQMYDNRVTTTACSCWTALPTRSPTPSRPIKATTNSAPDVRC